MYTPLIPYEFYTDEYRAGMPNPPLDKDSFPFFERKAWTTLNWKNVDIETLKIDNGDFPEYLKLAICAFAELELQRENVPKFGDVLSEKAFQYSYTLKDIKDKNEFKALSRQIVSDYIFGTELWSSLGYRGV